MPTQAGICNNLYNAPFCVSKSQLGFVFWSLSSLIATTQAVATALISSRTHYRTFKQAVF